MIRKLRIANYRSCQKVVLNDLSDLVALIGRNGAGKTNVLRAIDWLARMATAPDAGGVAFASSFPPISTSVELEIELGGYRYGYSLERTRGIRSTVKSLKTQAAINESLTRKSLTDDADEVLFERKGITLTSPLGLEDLNLKPLVGGPFAIVSVLPGDHPLVVAVRPVFDFLQAIKYYPFDELNSRPVSHEAPYIPKEVYQEWAVNEARDGDTSDSVTMRLIHMALHDKPKFDALKRLLGRDSLGLIDSLQVDEVDVPVDRDRPDLFEKKFVFYMVVFKPTLSNAKQSGGGPFFYEHLSTGTRRILRILVSLFFDAASVMLLEHPEDSIHTGLVRKLIAAFKTDAGSTQIIMTSHSSTVLNELEPGDVRMVAMKDGKTAVRGLNKKEIADATAYLKEDGTLSEFFELAEEESP